MDGRRGLSHRPCLVWTKMEGLKPQVTGCFRISQSSQHLRITLMCLCQTGPWSPLQKHDCPLMVIAHKATEEWRSQRSFHLKLELNLTEFLLAPDSQTVCSHSWQVAWETDIKDEICAHFAELTFLPVSCCRRRSVNSPLLPCWTCHCFAEIPSICSVWVLHTTAFLPHLVSCLQKKLLQVQTLI